MIEGYEFAASRRPTDYPANLLRGTCWRMARGNILTIVSPPRDHYTAGKRRVVVDVECDSCGATSFRRLTEVVKLRAHCPGCLAVERGEAA